MDKFEYVVALAAVITGLGLSDVAVSLHRLLKRRGGVRWDWVPIVLSLYAALVLMRLWYQLWSVRETPFVVDLPFVAVQVVQTLVLVLFASAALPDEDDFKRGRIDLRRYYARHRRYVWTTYLVFQLMWIATAVYFYVYDGRQARLIEPAFLLYFALPILLTLAAIVGRRRVQVVALVLLVTHEILIPSNLLGLRMTLTQFFAGGA